jgi:hypothetical protein
MFRANASSIEINLQCTARCCRQSMAAFAIHGYSVVAIRRNDQPGAQGFFVCSVRDHAGQKLAAWQGS